MGFSFSQGFLDKSFGSLLRVCSEFARDLRFIQTAVQAVTT